MLFSIFMVNITNPAFSRDSFLKKVQEAFQSHRLVCLLGPRQCGKTTLARQLWALSGGDPQKKTGYFDLENPIDLQLLENPGLALKSLRGLIILDEIQRRPDLFPFLRYLHDEQLDQHFLILGSAARGLIQQSSESLAGRIAFLEMTPFQLKEGYLFEPLWVKGGFPRSYLLPDSGSWEWRMNYIRSYIEQDLGTFGVRFDPHLLRRFWFMLSHVHGQIFNASEIAGSLGISAPTVRQYLSYLEASFLIRILHPWFENIKKRQVKSPKIYFRDSGLLHTFLGIHNEPELRTHPKGGASWEGFAIEQICFSLNKEPQECFFWASHQQAELDLLILHEGKKVGFELKYQDAPKMTPSLRIAQEDLQLDQLYVVYPGKKDYKVSETIQVLGLEAFCTSGFKK